MSFVNISVATSLLRLTVLLLVFTFLLEDHSLHFVMSVVFSSDLITGF